MENKKGIFSTREWVFITIILALVQAGIWYVSFIDAKSASALNYVSFAGTLISIILAVLAIGYTYGESVAEKSKKDNIEDQIAILNQAIKNIYIDLSRGGHGCVCKRGVDRCLPWIVRSGSGDFY